MGAAEKIINFSESSAAQRESYGYGSNLDIVWETDPRMLGVRLARYKFVAKMFSGLVNVAEVGAGDGWMSRVVSQSVENVLRTDAHPAENSGIVQWNPVTGWYTDYGRIKGFDGIYALDVLEHVHQEEEGAFMRGIVSSLKPTGSLIIGMPSLESQPFASQKSRESHINCKTESQFRGLMSKYFNNVFIFGMNDEVVHTGYAEMCHYRMAVCAGKK